MKEHTKHLIIHTVFPIVVIVGVVAWLIIKR